MCILGAVGLHSQHPQVFLESYIHEHPSCFCSVLFLGDSAVLRAPAYSWRRVRKSSGMILRSSPPLCKGLLGHSGSEKFPKLG